MTILNYSRGIVSGELQAGLVSSACRLFKTCRISVVTTVAESKRTTTMTTERQLRRRTTCAT